MIQPLKIKMMFLGVLLQITAAIASADSALVVRDAWIRAAPPSAPVMAGYMTIENRSHEHMALVRASSPAFTDITIHRTEDVHGVARMTHTPRIEIAPLGELHFQPGGYHLMLAQARRPLRAGDEVPIELAFADGTRASAVFVVREQPDGTADGRSHARRSSTPSRGEAFSHRH